MCHFEIFSAPVATQGHESSSEKKNCCVSMGACPCKLGLFRHGCEMENYLPYDQAPHIYKNTFSVFIYTYYHLHEGEKLASN